MAVAINRVYKPIRPSGIALTEKEKNYAYYFE